MSDIEKEEFRQIGIDLINEYRVRGGLKPIDWLVIDTPEVNAFIRSIQLHEKTKKELQGVKQELADFRQKVSDVVYRSLTSIAKGCAADAAGDLSRFIIPAPKPDPLVDVWKQQYPDDPLPEASCNNLYAALDAAGFEIREKGQ